MISRDAGPYRMHAGAGPAWSTTGDGVGPLVAACSAGFDRSLAGGDLVAPHVWLALRGDAASDGTLAATLGLRLELDFSR